MDINANNLSLSQLVALIEARQFPIGVDFTDPLARRLYDACSVLMCHASVAGRQASIACRYINTAMSEMGNNQGGYYHLKKCLEEMNAQMQGETAAVVLCQQYQEELNGVVPAAKLAAFGLRDAATNLESIIPDAIAQPPFAEYAAELSSRGNLLVALLRGSAELLDELMAFTCSPSPQGDRHE